MKAHVEFEFTGVNPALYALITGIPPECDPRSIIW
jgi:hypothetical protein